jgi:hypothetical protein
MNQDCSHGTKEGQRKNRLMPNAGMTLIESVFVVPKRGEWKTTAMNGHPVFRKSGMLTLINTGKKQFSYYRNNTEYQA